MPQPSRLRLLTTLLLGASLGAQAYAAYDRRRVEREADKLLFELSGPNHDPRLAQALAQERALAYNFQQFPREVFGPGHPACQDLGLDDILALQEAELARLNAALAAETGAARRQAAASGRIDHFLKEWSTRGTEEHSLPPDPAYIGMPVTLRTREGDVRPGVVTEIINEAHQVVDLTVSTNDPQQPTRVEPGVTRQSPGEQFWCRWEPVAHPGSPTLSAVSAGAHDKARF